MIYRFKVWFEEIEDVYRWIDIKPSHTFLDFHNIIQEAIGFDKKELSSFYVSDDKWRKGFEILSEDMGLSEEEELKALMKDAKIRDYVNDPHQKFVYITDYVAHWTLLIELQSINDEAPKKEYPLVFRSEGKAPRQREDSRFKMVDDNELDALAEKILAKKKSNIMEGAEEEYAVANDDEDNEDAEDGEENDEILGFDEFTSEV